MEPDDPRKMRATAKVVFRGTFLGWLNESSEYEAAAIKCPRHDFTMTIKPVPVSAQWEEPPVPPIPGFVGELTPTIDFTVINPVEGCAGITFFRPDVFERTAENHPCHFDWALDLHNKELHGEKLPVNASGYKLIVRLNSGLIYTERVTQRPLLRYTWDGAEHDGEEPTMFGRVALRTGINLVCDPQQAGSGVCVNTPAGPIWLPHLEGLRYDITITNDCQGSSEIGSDFRQLYLSGAVAVARGRRKYDFYQTTGDGNYGVPQEFCTLVHRS